MSLIKTLAHERSSYHVYLGLALGLLAGSFAAIFIKASLENGIPANVVAFGRMGLAAILLTPVVFLRYRDDLQRIHGRDLLLALFAGAWLALHFNLLIAALDHVSIMVNQVLVNSSPLWIGLLEVAFLKARFGRLVWYGLFVAIFGGIIIALSSGGAAEDIQLLGVILALTGSMAGSVYLLIGRAVRRKLASIPYVWLVFSSGAIVGLIYLIISGTPITGYPATGYFWLLMLTLIPQIIGHSMFNYVMAFLPATVVSISAQIVTVNASILAIFLFSELPSLPQIVGGAVIISGVVLAIYGQNKR